MSSWFKVDLGDPMLANEELSALKTYLSDIYESQGKPENMLAIYRHESAGLHCNLILYLTAEFQHTAMLSNALKCNISPLSDSGFLAGNKEAFLSY